MEAERAKVVAEGGEVGEEAVEIKQEPPSPHTSFEEMSLQRSMDKNKESLKRKLMMRRSLIELVDQGIYPPPKTPPAFAEQRKLLERAKTGDLLRHKIQHRPDRQLLVQQHILEDTRIDPSLHERQRQLKRARLADNLNDKLLHRPGVLELVEGNILPDENLLEAIKDGSITFNKSVDQGDEDSQSLYTVMDEGNKSCDESPSSDQNEDSSMSDISSPPIPQPPLPFHEISLVFSKPSQSQVQHFTFHTKIPEPSASSSLVASTLQKNTPVSAFSGMGNSLSPKSVTSVSSNNKSRPKKLKPKTQPKAKVIKFHEYKGPPNVVKTQQIIQQNNTQETPYHVLLQQQQLFLQWQLEFQQKNMNNINVPVLVPAQKVVTPEGQQGTQFVSSSPVSSATNVTVTSVASMTTAPITITQQNGPQTIISVAASQPAAPTPATVIKASKFQHHIKLESSLQNQATTSVKPEPMLVAQPQPQLPPSGIQNPLPISQPAPRCSSSSIKSQNKKPSNTPSTPSKPITSLEDMKVADLRAELKKRNLPVSGPKPQLIERLKPYTDVIIQASQNYISSYGAHSVTSPASVQTSQDSVMSPTSTVYSPPESVAPNEDIIGSNAVSPLAPIHSITSVVSMPSVMSPEDPKSISPPTTPIEFQNILTPMSPDMMDIPSPSNATIGQQTKSQQLNASQNSTAMNIDISRPPSVMADAPMEVDSSELLLNVSQASQVLTQTTPATIKFLQSPHVQTQPLQLQQQQRPLVQVVQPQPQQQQVQISQCQLSQEELLKQQQQKIEELQRQLEESQFRLKLQLLQHQHMQQQQQNLQQLQQQQQQIQQIQQQQAQLQQQAAQQQQAVMSKPVQLKQPNSPPQVIINVPNSKTVSPQHHQTSSAPPPPPPPPPPLPSQPQVGLGSSKPIHIPAQLLQAVQTTHGLPAVIVTSTKSDHDRKKPNLSKIFKNQSINQSLKMGGKMVSVASAPAELHKFILTTTSTPISSSGQAPINGIITPARMSLPGSPVDDGNSKQPLGKSQSNPFFIPLKEPPKYDEAIKRRQQHQGTTPTVQESTKTQPATHTMDDVLEILIRSGELPPSAAQEPPPTPKTTIQTDTICTISIAQAGTMPVENFMPSAGTIQLVTALSTAAISDNNTVENLTSVQEPVSSVPQTFKQEPLSPPSFTEPASSPPPVETNTDFLDINDMLGQDLNSMDWTSDPAFSGLDLTDTSNITTDFDFKHFINERSLLEFPTSHLSNSMKSFYGSEPDLAALGLSDTGENSNMQIDVPDWFDVIMPSTGMTPLSGNAPVSFPSDPILTPRTHQEVLDLFSFDDTDLSTPSELTYGTNWDKITEGTASST